MSKSAWVLPISNKRTGYFAGNPASYDRLADGEGQQQADGAGQAIYNDDNEYEENYLETLNIGVNGIVTSIYQLARTMGSIYNFAEGYTNWYVNGWLGNLLMAADGTWHWINATDSSLSKTQANIDAAYVRYTGRGLIHVWSTANWHSSHAKYTFTPGYVYISRPIFCSPCAYVLFTI